MSTTVTIRTDEELRTKLQRRAEAEGTTVSALVREILEAALEDSSVADRAGHLKGRLELPVDPESPWQRQLRERNWRP